MKEKATDIFDSILLNGRILVGCFVSSCYQLTIEIDLLTTPE